MEATTATTTTATAPTTTTPTLSKATISLTFLGTSSGIPTLDRNVSCIALHGWNAKDVFLVDCGDGTQRRLLEAGISFARIRGVFVTHMHGDHVYGMVPLLAMISMISPTTRELFVVGPVGIRKFVEETAASTQLFLRYELRFVELPHNVTQANVVIPTMENQPFEITACPLKHRVPCFGYIFREPSRRSFDSSVAQLKGIRGADLGRLARGEQVCNIATGEMVSRDDCLGNPVAGRVIIILGDTCGSESIAEALSGGGCDLLVHECTYDETLKEKARDTGHSTSLDAGMFAKRVGAKLLVLTHFSARYPVGDVPLPVTAGEDSLKNSANLLAEARAAADGGLVEEARDLSVFHVAPPPHHRTK